MNTNALAAARAENPFAGWSEHTYCGGCHVLCVRCGGADWCGRHAPCSCSAEPLPAPAAPAPALNDRRLS